MEALVACRGPLLEQEEEENYDHNKLLEFIHNNIKLYPSVGKPRSIIDKWKAKDKLPLQEYKEKEKARRTRFPNISPRAQAFDTDWRKLKDRYDPNRKISGANLKKNLHQTL